MGNLELVIFIHPFPNSPIHQLQLRSLKKNWLAWLILGGPVLVYAIGKLLTR